MSVIKLSKKKYIVDGVPVRAPSGVYHDGSYWRYVSFSDQGGMVYPLCGLQYR